MATAGLSLAERFSRTMDGLGPYEKQPDLAVALSGGGDSMALVMLARGWVRERGGRLTALTVDHGLRRGSDAEARHIGALMAGLGVDHHILTWRGAKPATGIQEAARANRYALLRDWCADNGVLHLLLGHQADDQAETVEMRQRAQSAGSGLAGMSMILEMGGVRVLRPLLEEPAQALRQWLGEQGIAWIEDPTNQDQRFTRNRIRAHLANHPVQSSDRLRLARENGRERQMREQATAGFLARRARLFRAGYLEVSDPAEIGVDPLERMLCCVGGLSHSPPRRAMGRVVTALRDFDRFSGASLGRCVLSRHGNVLRIVRECRNLPSPLMLMPGETLIWDGRFRVANPLDRSLQLVPLENHTPPEGMPLNLPAIARASLPVVLDAGKVIALGPFGSVRAEQLVLFQPVRALSPEGFCCTQPAGREK